MKIVMNNERSSITTKEEALSDLEKQYETPGKPLYMSGISKIKDECITDQHRC